MPSACRISSSRIDAETMKSGHGPTRRHLLTGIVSASVFHQSQVSAQAGRSDLAKPESRLRVHRHLPPLPDREGFAGMFAGVVDGKLLAAGGANFPQGYPWQGGRKVWYDQIFILDSPDEKTWSKSDLRMLLPAGYGLSFSFENRMFIAGGETGPSVIESKVEPVCLKTVISFGFEKGKLASRPEPSIPEPLKDSCGVLIGNRFFLVGGLTSPSATMASNRLYILDLNDRLTGWRRGPDLPAAGRFQSVAGTDGRNLFVYSGIVPKAAADGTQIRSKPYLREVWRFSPGSNPLAGQWKRLADMPREAAAAPSPAIRSPLGDLVILSGATGADHSKPQQSHEGWTSDALIHEPAADRWHVVRKTFETGQAVVTAPTVHWTGIDIAVSGEIAPGRRTPTLSTIDYGN